MFTGIIEELGQVCGLSQKGNITQLEIMAKKIVEDIKIGESVAVNGTCLTVTEKKRKSLCFAVMPETMRVTNLGALTIGRIVNLERALKVGDRLSGHFVYGHIDCTGVIRSKKYSAGNLIFEITVPQKFMANILLKGSVAVDGISLTIAEKKADSFAVYVIPHTLENTTLKFKGPSDKVNVEFDILTKKAA